VIVARRVLLKGAGAVVVAGAGSVWRASDQGVFSVGRGPAYEAWYRWRSDPAEGPLALVRAAVLAANPHNSQPWLFRVTDSSIDLFADPSRNLGPIDPDLREMYVQPLTELRPDRSDRGPFVSRPVGQSQ
jgi:hypothetical protein